jgi:integrase
VQYLASAEYRSLDPRTQRVRRGILESTCREPLSPGSRENFAEFPIHRLTAKAIRVLRDRKADLPEAANGRVKAIRRLFAWAIEAEYVTTNPARDVSYKRRVTEGHHAWTEEEIAQFEGHHPVGTKARLALALLAYTGVRRSDVVLLGRQHIRHGWLKFVAQTIAQLRGTMRYQKARGLAGRKPTFSSGQAASSPDDIVVMSNGVRLNALTRA